MFWAFVRLRPSRAVAAWLGWAATGLRPVRPGLALALVRPGAPAPPLPGDRRRADRDPGPVLRPGLRRSRRPLALPLVLLRGDGAGRPPPARRARAGPRLVAGRRTDPFPLLLAGSIALFLVLFSTRVPVYDGERLFLLVFPLWAILIGRGFAIGAGVGSGSTACAAGRPRWRSCSRKAFGVVALHPFGLSYYNLLVGGLPGAERLGLELTYWGDAVDRVLLDRLARSSPPGEASAALAPTLYPGQGMRHHDPAAWCARGSSSRTRTPSLRADWVVVSRRTAYWRPSSAQRLGPPGAASRPARRQGVWLSALAGESRPKPRAPDRDLPSNLQTSPWPTATICRIRSERIETSDGVPARVLSWAS